MTKKSFALFYRLHTWVGIYISLHCLVLFATGAVLIFKDEITDFTRDTDASFSIQESIQDTLSPVQQGQVVDQILGQTQKDFPRDRPLSFSRDEEDSRSFNLRLGINGTSEFRGARRLAFDTRTGHLKTTRASETGFFAWILKLHRDIFLGSYGKIYVGFVGLLYVFTLVSGFFIYGNFMKKSAYAEIRRQSSRSFFADIHRFVGVSTLAWSLLVGITGMLLAFNSSLIKIYQYTELKKLNAEYALSDGDKSKGPPSLWPPAKLSAVIETVTQAKPEFEISFVAFPETQFSIPNHFIVLVNDKTKGFSRNVSELVIVDSRTAKLVQVRTLPFYLKLLMLSEPLHFGNYGGWLLKVIWLLFAMVSFAMPISGLIIFYRRKRKERRGNTDFNGAGFSQKLENMEARANDGPFVFRSSKNPYRWPLVWFSLFLVAMALPLLSLGRMPWYASLLCAIPAVLVIVRLLVLLRTKKSFSR